MQIKNNTGSHHTKQVVLATRSIKRNDVTPARNLINVLYRKSWKFPSQSEEQSLVGEQFADVRILSISLEIPSFIRRQAGFGEFHLLYYSSCVDPIFLHSWTERRNVLGVKGSVCSCEWLFRFGCCSVRVVVNTAYSIETLWSTCTSSILWTENIIDPNIGLLLRNKNRLLSDD